MDRLLIPIAVELLSKLLRIIFEKLSHTYLKAYKTFLKSRGKTYFRESLISRWIELEGLLHEFDEIGDFLDNEFSSEKFNVNGVDYFSIIHLTDKNSININIDWLDRSRQNFTGFESI